jgi:hypothetical protein
VQGQLDAALVIIHFLPACCQYQVNQGSYHIPTFLGWRVEAQARWLALVLYLFLHLAGSMCLLHQGLDHLYLASPIYPHRQDHQGSLSQFPEVPIEAKEKELVLVLKRGVLLEMESKVVVMKQGVGVANMEVINKVNSDGQAKENVVMVVEVKGAAAVEVEVTGRYYKVQVILVVESETEKEIVHKQAMKNLMVMQSGTYVATCHLHHAGALSTLHSPIGFHGLHGVSMKSL